MIKVSDYIFEFLKKKGAKHIFMLPGGGAMHLVDSLGKSGIEYTCVLHEQAAAIAAESYGQHTNLPGICCVTSGPGATNTLTGVVAGWIDSTPMFIISGQAKRSDLVGDKGVRQIGSQEVQIVDMVSPVTKFAVQILEPEKIKYYLERAYYEAVSGRPGPVWLDIPLDVQGTMINEEELEGFTPDETVRVPSEEDILQIVELLKNAQKPLFLAGNGIKLANATDEFISLLENLDIPVQTTWKTIDMFDENHPLYAGHPGSMGDRGANFIIQECDLLVSIGSRIDTSLTAFNDRNFAKKAKKVIVDIDENEIRRMDMDKEVWCACDAGDFIASLKNALVGIKLPDISAWKDYCTSIRKKNPVVLDTHRDKKDYISCYYFIDQLCDALDSDDIIVPESSGAAGEITYQAFRIKKGQKMKNAAGLGSMGFGVPYAIGACLANDRKRTILIDGDGAFQMNIQELETIRRLSLPIKIFIWNNNGYASIRNMQTNTFNSHYVACGPDSGLTLPDSKRIAQAYEIPAIRLNTNQQMKDHIKEILESDGPMICELMVDPLETISPRVKAKKMPDGNMVSMPLEKMWPYLTD